MCQCVHWKESDTGHMRPEWQMMKYMQKNLTICSLQRKKRNKSTRNAIPKPFVLQRKRNKKLPWKRTQSRSWLRQVTVRKQKKNNKLNNHIKQAAFSQHLIKNPLPPPLRKALKVMLMFSKQLKLLPQNKTYEIKRSK